MQSKLTHRLMIQHASLPHTYTYLQSTLRRHGAPERGQASFPRREVARRGPGGRRCGPGSTAFPREVRLRQGPRRLGLLRQVPLRQQESDDGGRVQQRLHQEQGSHVLHMGERL